MDGIHKNVIYIKLCSVSFIENTDFHSFLKPTEIISYSLIEPCRLGNVEICMR